MGAELAESRRGRSVETHDRDHAPMRERWTGEDDDQEENEFDEARDSEKHRSKDKSKSSGRREDREHRIRDQDRSKALDSSKEREKENKDYDKDRLSGRDKRKEDRDEREKEKVQDRVREKDADREKQREKEKDKERKDQVKEKEREREREKELEKDGERGLDKEKGKEKSRDKDKDREKERDRAKVKEREKHKERERERENVRERGKDTAEREKAKERSREKEKQADQEKDRVKDRDRSGHKQRDENNSRRKDMDKYGSSRLDDEYSLEQVGSSDDEKGSKNLKHQEKAEIDAAVSHQSGLELEDRISKMREERLKKSSEGASEVLSWVNRSRKLEEKRNAEKEKALQLSKIFEEQDNMNDRESDDEAAAQQTTHDLGGVKVLHGLDKVIEGGAVVLTLKDQSILADGDINQEVDMLENVEIGEQKRRDEAYKAAKKKTGVYDDKFNDEPGAEKKILPQYDDPVADEGVILDSSGRLTSEAERKLEELRKRIQGVSTAAQGEDLSSMSKMSTDYYTEEEMMKFKKPKKKKSLRKKEKLDLDALEAEARSAGLGTGDLGSRNDERRQNLRKEQERIEAEMRSTAYQAAIAKADEASKALRQEQVHMQAEGDDAPVFGDDDDELRKSLERARKIALKKQAEEEKSGPQVISGIASSSVNDSTAGNSNSGSGDQQENKVVFTEMEEFVWGLQLDEDEKQPESEDVFMEEDVVPSTSDHEMKDEDNGWAEVKETIKDETPAKENKEEVVPDETIHESAVGKGLAGALKLLKDRGTLKETIEWGGRNMDKKKSKLVGIYDNEGQKEIRIDRTDEYGRILTPKEAFRLLSHKFHGKGPGKMKQEKRMRQYYEELKVKQMKNADTPSLSVERMREAQAKLQTPYLVLSGHVKPGQSSDPRSGFATVEKDFAGGLTPMLGDKKVEHFLNIKRKPEPGDAASQKKPKT
ncbi:U4/U6.U5 snRNP associated protein [Handroanthus impetiginosus]|uniref:U4/U6.U5 snRNP associated protein n=1 Tax=Handroanthus impetiginosus TaxID=429701 RepID=A0A2G9H5I4_9LAMI|nr:U4/U6.U5 snRNP associated protein [Handroanthus impetiginosus]